MATTSTSATEDVESSPDTIMVLDLERGEVVCDRCELADSPWRRLRGLMGRAGMGRNDGLMLCPAGSIHTWFMRFPIDVVFLDSDLRVVRLRESLRPWRAAVARGARAVLELPAGEGRRRGLVAGRRLLLVCPARDGAEEDMARTIGGAR